MKQIISHLLLAGGLLCCACTQNVAAQEYTTHVSKEFTLKKNADLSVLSVYNVFGSVTVEGYSGDKILVEVDQRFTSKKPEALEEARREFKLAFDQYDDTVIAYIAEPFDSRPQRKRQQWGDHKNIDYIYTLTFTIKVPFAMNLNLSTINNGEVSVKDVGGSLRLHNINGGINVKNAKGKKIELRTINGNVSINHVSIPSAESSYYTLNGKLEATYPASLSADISFKSMNGGFYTDFPDVQVLPSRVTKTEEKKADGVIYRLSKASDVRVGNGGTNFRFETLNGNIYIRKQS